MTIFGVQVEILQCFNICCCCYGFFSPPLLIFIQNWKYRKSLKKGSSGDFVPAQFGALGSGTEVA